MFLFIFEGLGTSELLLILIVALVLFGPRKLPQLSRSLGKSLANFKRASEDFKQTWEKEVARESAIKEAITGEAMLPEDRSIMSEPRMRSQAVLEASENGPMDQEAAATVARGAALTAETEDAPPSSSKRDWL